MDDPTTGAWIRPIQNAWGRAGMRAEPPGPAFAACKDARDGGRGLPRREPGTPENPVPAPFRTVPGRATTARALLFFPCHGTSVPLRLATHPPRDVCACRQTV